MPRFLQISALLSVLLSPVAAEDEIVISEGAKTLPLPGEAFKLNGRDAFVILPPGETKKDVPWVWYAPTLRGLPEKRENWMFERFLAAGIAVAGIDVGESYGSPAGRKLFSQFYKEVTENRGLATKASFLARSRGGLMAYGWAAENANKVACIAGVYPVCNIASYPGIAKASPAYEMTADELTSKLAEHNPIDRLAPLAEAGVPIFHIHGDVDKVVPLEKNSAIVAERYKAMDGPITLEVVKGQGHNFWSGWFQSQNLVDFVIAHSTAKETKD